MSDSLVVTHFLTRKGVEKRVARNVGRIINDVADKLRNGNADFLTHFKDTSNQELRNAWRLASGAIGDEPVTIDAFDLKNMLPDKKEHLFALADDGTLQTRLSSNHGAIKDYLVFTSGPTGTETAHPEGQRLMHAIRVSLGDKIPEGLMGKRYGNSFARVLCRHIKHVLYLHAVYVMLGDADGIAKTEPLAECLPMALPIAFGPFQSDEVTQTGPIFMVCRLTANR